MRVALCLLATSAVATAATAVASPGTSPADMRLASSLVIHRADLPAGWKARSNPSAACAKPIGAPGADVIAVAVTRFERVDLGVAYSRAEVFRTTAEAKAAFRRAAGFFASCVLRSLRQAPGAKNPAVRELKPGDPRLGGKPLPRFGEAGRAWEASVAAQDLSLYGELYLMRLGRADVLYTLAYEDNPPLTELFGLVRKALARARR